MIVLLLPPVVLALIVAAAPPGRWLARAAFAATVPTCAAVPWAIWPDPYVDDNDPPEYLAQRDRWALAAEVAGWLSLMTVPVGLPLVASIREAVAATARPPSARAWPIVSPPRRA